MGQQPSTSSPSCGSCTSATSCPECGADGATTSAACEQRFQELGLERFDDSELASDWRLIVDCYSLQHETYILSGRSLAAHLTGVCIALERGGDQALLRATQQWLSRTRDVTRPAIPTHRGEVNLNDVIAALPEDRHAVVVRWAASAWRAWSEHHALARGWIVASSRAPDS